MCIHQGFVFNHFCRQNTKKRKIEVVEEFNEEDDDDDLEDKGCVEEILDDDGDECAVEASDDEEAESDLIEENVAKKTDSVNEKSSRLR